MSNTTHKELFRSENKINKKPTNNNFLNKKVNRSASDVKSSFEKEKSREYLNGKYKAGRWKKDEHIRFLKGCFIHRNNWKKVKEVVKTRSSSQIRSHAQKYIIKLCKKYMPESFIDISNIHGEREIIDNSNLTPENIELIILSIFKPDVYPMKKILKIDYDNLCFPEDLGDSDYEDNSNDEKINTKSRSSFDVKNHEKYICNSFSVSQSQNNLDANDLFKACQLISGNSEKSVEFRNLISLNIPGISDLNEKELNLLLMLNDETYFKNLMGIIESLQRNQNNNNFYNCSIDNNNLNNQVFTLVTENANKIFISKDIMDLESKNNSSHEKEDSSKFEDKIEINLEDVFLNSNNELINNLNTNNNNDLPNKNSPIKALEDLIPPQKSNSNIEKNQNFENNILNLIANTNTNATNNSIWELVNTFIQNEMKDNIYYNTRESHFNTKHLSLELIKNFLPNNKDEKADSSENHLELINSLFRQNIPKDKFTEEDLNSLKASLIDVNMLKKFNEFNEEELKFKNYLDSMINSQNYFRIHNDNNTNNILSQYGIAYNGSNSSQNFMLDCNSNIHLSNDANYLLNVTNSLNSNNNNNLLDLQNLNLINSLINHNQNLEAVDSLNYLNQISNLSSVPMNLSNYNNDLIMKLLLEQTAVVNNMNNIFNPISNLKENITIVQKNESAALNINNLIENSRINTLLNANINERLVPKENKVNDNFDFLGNLKNTNSSTNLEHKLTTFDSAINFVDNQEDKKIEGTHLQNQKPSNTENNFPLLHKVNSLEYVNDSNVNNLDTFKNFLRLRELQNNHVINTSCNLSNTLKIQQDINDENHNKDENS